eukprot:Skav201893  [mRNA]  locus=scaffold550:821951:826546:+ [translate_table: standard]
MRAGRAHSRAPQGVVWPMPLPFPELHLRGGNRSQMDVDRKLGLNFLVIILNSLKYQDGKCLGFFPGLGTKLNREQWRLVRDLTPHVDEWNAEDPIGPEQMGRSAAKVESVEQVLSRLFDFAMDSSTHHRAYGRQVFRGDEADELEPCVREEECGVVGSVPHVQDPLAKRVEPSRFKFWGVPSFDPSKFLDSHNRDTFLYPLDWADPPDVDAARPPRVRVHVHQHDVVPLLETLDQSARLQLLPEDRVRMPFRNGMFSIPKDASRDRMVLDARPPNCLEDGRDSDWIGSLGSVSQFNHWFLHPDEYAVVYSEDIREYYHAFKVSPQRLQRNALALEVFPHQVSHLECFEPWMWKCKKLVPCLSTMAMGDCRAVTYGQVAHLSCLLRCSKLGLDDFITLRGRPGRGDFLAGLMIDDFLLVEKRRTLSEPLEKTPCQQIIEEVRDIYKEVGLPRHEGKSVQAEAKSTFWGVDFDGVRGLVRPSLKRAIPVVFIVCEMLKLGYTSVGLLEVLAGSFVSIFQCRRRFMSALDYVYREQRCRKRSDVLKLSRELANELLQCVGLTALACIDMRLKPSNKLVASDASPWATAAVCTDLSCEATGELHRHGLQRGLWNKLLSPVQAYLREKGLLDDDSQLPEEAKYDMHPVWEEIVMSKPFRRFGRTKRRRGRQHINLGEVGAALDAEELQGRREPGSYYIHLQDSQVSLACLVKGRSSSAAINYLLRGSIPGHVQHNNRAFYGYVRSKKNPADAPTRNREVPLPQRSVPEWLEQAEAGDFDLLDSYLTEVGFDLAALRGLPPEEQLWEQCDVDVQSCSLRRKEKRKEMRSRRKTEALTRNSLDGGGPEAGAGSSGSTLGGGPSSSTGGGPEVGDGGSGLTLGGGTDAGSLQTSSLRPLVPLSSATATSEPVSLPLTPPVDLSTSQAGASVSPGLSPHLRKLLLSFDRSQFVLHSSFSDLESAFDSGPGILDLFAGSRGFSRACAERAPVWRLTFDLAHSPAEDLLSPPLQESLLKLIRGGAFAAMGAGPVCASFSQAVTPPCRTKQYPKGVPWASELQQLKNDMGNRMLAFVQSCVKCCLSHRVVFWVENPHLSWMWRQTDELSWDEILQDEQVGDLVLDYCRFRTPWRKRTRFRTSAGVLAGQKCLCEGGHRHVALRGRCKSKGVSYTKLAEPYPRGVCNILAVGTLMAAGFLPQRKKLDVNACARDCCRRIGEAINPGPKSRAAQRPDVWLGDVQLLEPATVALRGRIWKQFCSWFEQTVGDKDPLKWLETSPLLFVQLLVGFGHFCYAEGVSLATYRQLLAHCSKTYPQVKPVLGPAWETVSKWEMQEPIQHRPPIPEPVLLSMVTVALAWGWERWTAVTLASFYAVARLGEVLRVKRSEILTPSDLLQDGNIIYIRFALPKTRRRGARVQYSTVEDSRIVPFLCKIWNKLKPQEPLYPASQGAYRTRWNAVLKALQISAQTNLTPGRLRGGGAVYQHRRGMPLTGLLWKMRLQHPQTLAFYLQETVAVSLLPSLPRLVRHRIQLLCEFFPHFIT